MAAGRAAHDIGKAVNHEVEGPHAVVGSEFIRRHGESDAVVTAWPHITMTAIGPLNPVSAATPSAPHVPERGQKNDHLPGGWKT
jgi:hypothetical protein